MVATALPPYRHTAVVRLQDMSSHYAAPSGFGGAFLTDLPTRAAYSEGAGPYRIVPAAVAVPRDVEDLAALVRWATAEDTPLVPRGAGSGMPGGNVGAGVVVDLQELDASIAVTGDGATVGAAATWKALDEQVASRGLRFPPDPSSGAFCTIGGMVATNAAGARSLAFGSVRPWIRAIAIVTADGEAGWLTRGGEPAPEGGGRAGGDLAALGRLAEHAAPAIRQSRAAVAARFPRTTKNSSGYALDRFLESGDALDLIVGSEGTLAFVTRAVVGLTAVPAAEGGVLLALDDLESLPDVVARLLRFEPTAIELMDRTLLTVAERSVDIPLAGVEAVLLVGFERRAASAVREVVAGAVTAAEEAIYARTALGAADLDRLWSVRHAASSVLAALPASRRSLQIVEDGCVPVPQLGRYLFGVREAAGRAGVEVVAFGHAGDGHVHVNALVDTTDPDFPRRLEDLLGAVTELLLQLGGTPAGEHGDGRLRAPSLERFYGVEVVDLFRRVKRAFDPPGILNPGVILPPTGALALADLKVGDGAAAIPDEVARGLRRIEREAAWGRSKRELPLAAPR